MSDNRYNGGYRNDSRRGSGYGQREQYGQHDRYSQQPQRDAQEQYDQYGQFGERRQSGQYAQYGQVPRRDSRPQYDRQERYDDRGSAAQYDRQPRRAEQDRYYQSDGYSRDERYGAYAPGDGFDDDFDDMPAQPRQQRVPQGAQSAVRAPQRPQQGAQRPAPRPGAAPQRKPAAPQGRYKKSAMDNLLDMLKNAGEWCRQNQKLCIIGGVSAAAVIVITVLLCIGLGDCGGSGIPSVDQGDPESEFVYGETISGGDGQIIINEEGGSVDNFTVDVTSAVGTFTRDDGAQLVISEQDPTGFTYQLVMGGKTYAGYAYFIGASSAIQEMEDGLVNFEFSKEGVQISQTGPIAALGGNAAEGSYAGTVDMTEPTSIEEEEEELVEEETEEAQSSYNADVRETKAVTDALAAALSADEEKLVETIFQNGTCPVFQSPECVLDKNGKECIVDAEMQAVKYYAFIQGTGEELLLICEDDGTFWLGLCNGGSYRYFTNDSERRDNPPKAISGQATSKSMTLTY
ncbi:MAG: hypothetical protein E7559_07710 [Ruminococcaceae bacterium]|nr:hypothetical protein [Oscillospiraceae bacterium]